jgi:hypothetical protein
MGKFKRSLLTNVKEIDGWDNSQWLDI